MLLAVGLLVGLLVMFTPKNWTCHLFRLASLPLASFLACWHLCCYTATAVGPQEVGAFRLLSSLMELSACLLMSSAIPCRVLAQNEAIDMGDAHNGSAGC